MTLAPRAAAIRGDDLQHAIGWYWACQMLRDPDIHSVSIEDAGGGSFDDVVVRRHSGPHQYFQVKSSNYGAVTVDDEWLTTAKTKNGKSPLQHFYGTYADLREIGQDFTLELTTTRAFDADHVFLAKLLDKKSDNVATAPIEAAGPGSDIGKLRTQWAAHLDVSPDELIGFLNTVAWKHCMSEPDWLKQTQPLMELAGLKFDDEAPLAGARIVHDWVTDGKGPQTVDDLRAEVASKDLLALSGSLVLAVDGIDREPHPVPPTVTLDFVDLYNGDDAFSRKLLKEHSDWADVVLPAFTAAANDLQTYRVGHVHVTGSMRHPMWFAVGRALPQVKKWTLSADQVQGTWRTDVAPEAVPPRTIAAVELNKGNDIAIAVGLTGDPTSAVERFLREGDVPVGRLLVLGPEDEPSPTAVPSDAWAMGWTRAARDQLRSTVDEMGATHVHLFLLCPASIALMLGHQWNVLPQTTVYEFAGGTYEPTVSFAGA